MKSPTSRQPDAASGATDAPIPPAEFSADELCQLAAIERRTLRFYIDRGLVARPAGNTRSARYGPQHLEQRVGRDSGNFRQKVS